MVLYLKKLLEIFNNRRLPSEIQLRFLKQLARLLENGYSMIDALEVLKWDKQLIIAADQMIESLKHGISIDEAFERAKFHHTITTYLYFVKDNGDVLLSIKKGTEMFENRLKYMKKFQDMIRYPMILFFIFSILLYFINGWVLPSFLDIFQSNASASTMIIFTIMVIDYLVKVLLVFITLLIVICLIMIANKRKIPIQKQIKLYNVIPIYRKFLTLQTSFQFSIHLSTQLKTGMSIKEILAHMSQQKKLPIIAYYTSLMMTELSNGYPLSNLLSQLSFFENQLTLIFQKNSDNLALERDLAAYADMLTDELDRKTMKAITLIQPVFLILVGCFIIFIYLALMWPMMQMIRTT